MSGIDHTANLLAARAHLLTLSVVTTGSTTLAATTTGYTRASGSFVADGFALGMELTPAGFSSNDVSTITSVTALNITTKDERSAESASAGRSLTVGLPATRGWENVKVTPQSGEPYSTEEYVPGPTERISLGEYAQIEGAPVYLPRIFVPSNTGRAAASKYADAIMNHFAPGTDLGVADGELKVRGRPGPFAGQLLQLDSGWAVVPVTVPLLYRTTNSI